MSKNDRPNQKPELKKLLDSKLSDGKPWWRFDVTDKKR